MSERFIRIVGFGLIGVDKKNLPYRQVFFKDEQTGIRAEMQVSKKERPLLWQDVEKLEEGGDLPPYRGFITKFNNLDLVVFDNESIEDAFLRQKKLLNIQSEISYKEAEALRELSNAYITNLTPKNAFEISWREIDSKANIIKYRAYSGNGKFIWGNWFEIKQK